MHVYRDNVPYHGHRRNRHCQLAGGAHRDGVRALSINLSAVTFMDSTGLAALINIQRSVERARGRLVVVPPDARVRRLFAISGTDSLLGVEPSRSSPAAA